MSFDFFSQKSTFFNGAYQKLEMRNLCYSSQTIRPPVSLDIWQKHLFEILKLEKTERTPHFHVTLCTIWYHLCNLNNVKTYGGVILLVKLQVTFFTKSNILFNGCFSRF